MPIRKLSNTGAPVNMLIRAVKASGGWSQLARRTRITRRRLHAIRDGRPLTRTEELVLQHLIEHEYPTE